MTIDNLVSCCQASGAVGWQLVEFAQQLVNQQMAYSITNSYDTPELALIKGKGYCWHQAKVLNQVLQQLGFDCQLVHAFRNRFTTVNIMGVEIKNFVSGHVWCQVTIDAATLDVCPGSLDNHPGHVGFCPLSKVLLWNQWYDFLTYYGAPLVNYFRTIKYGWYGKR